MEDSKRMDTKVMFPSPKSGPLAPDVLLGVDEGVGGPGDLLLGGVALHAAHRVRGLTATLELGLAPEGNGRGYSWRRRSTKFSQSQRRPLLGPSRC